MLSKWVGGWEGRGEGVVLGVGELFESGSRSRRWVCWLGGKDKFFLWVRCWNSVEERGTVANQPSFMLT